jgi:hypothetical protein
MKISRISYFALIISLLFMFDSCEFPLGARGVYFFYIRNDSPNLIYYQVNRTYPDLSIPDSAVARVAGLNPSKIKTFESGTKWRKFFKNLPADTLSILFFSPDSVKKYGWEQVQSKYLILKRKDISIEDLERSNYLTTYP